MKKYSFYTLIKDREARGIKAVLVDGYFDKVTNLYFYRDKELKEWYSVCILTGLSIARGSTRSHCYKETQKVLDLYRRALNTPYGNKLVEQYNEAVKIALMTR